MAQIEREYQPDYGQYGNIVRRPASASTAMAR